MENLELLYIDETPYVDLNSLIDLFGVYSDELKKMTLEEQLELYGDLPGFLKAFIGAFTQAITDQR